MPSGICCDSPEQTPLDTLADAQSEAQITAHPLDGSVSATSTDQPSSENATSLETDASLGTGIIDQWLQELLDDPKRLSQAGDALYAGLIDSLAENMALTERADQIEDQMLDRALDRMLIRAEAELHDEAIAENKS